MKFNVLPGKKDPEPEKTLDVQLVGHDGGVLLRARRVGSGGWTYIAKLSEEGLSLFSCGVGLGIRSTTGDGRVHVPEDAEPYPGEVKE